MGIRSKIISALMKKDQIIADRSSEDDIRGVIRLLRPLPTGIDLIRIGSDGDGGYLIPDDLEGIKHCFSPGVSEIADFEGHLASAYGIKSFLADASVEAPPTQNNMFEFDKKFLGSRDGGEFIRLSSWMEDKLPTGDRSDLILQMDIEGAEYDVLIDTPMDVLRRFRIIVIEFHQLHMLLNKMGPRFLKPIFEKIMQDFVVAHIHPNNYRPPVSAYGIDIPKIVEITFLRKDRIRSSHNVTPLSFPHRMDRKNAPDKPDVVLPEVWWKTA